MACEFQMTNLYNIYCGYSCYRIKLPHRSRQPPKRWKAWGRGYRYHYTPYSARMSQYSLGPIKIQLKEAETMY